MNGDGGLDIDLIHEFLSNSAYWALGRTRETVERSVENSLPFDIYEGGRQVGFARVITDYSLPEFRGRGLSVWLMEVIGWHPRRFEFQELEQPERWMERSLVQEMPTPVRVGNQAATPKPIVRPSDSG